MAKITLKNILKKHQDIPFLKIKPGDSKTIEIEKSDDIHFRAMELGYLIKVKETEESVPKKIKKKIK